MKNISLDISGNVSPENIAVISEISEITGTLGLEYFVVGATARDFILEGLYGLRVPRMTMDIDLGIKVRDWNHYTTLRDALLDSGLFGPDDESKFGI